MPDEAGRTILVVEDQTEVRHLITQLLTRRGFRILEAGDGHEALALIDAFNTSISLAILDMVLPTMSGLDVAAELQRRHPEIQVLYLSGYAGSIAMDSIQRRSPELLLLKPFTEEGLLSRINGMLGTDPKDSPDR